MAARLGADFSDVRGHADSAAQRSVAEMEAASLSPRRDRPANYAGEDPTGGGARMADSRGRSRTVFGAYLRRLREATDPESLGLPRGQRRVSGLRREEVATFAGVSVDYYTRLEQGREENPSQQMLDSLCRVLQLNEDQRVHFHRLAGTDPAPRPAPLTTDVPREIHLLLERWSMNPAFVYNDAQDIVAVNCLGQALYQGFSSMANFAQMMFVDPHAKSFYVDWDLVALDTVGALRQAWGKPSVRPGVQEVVDRLTAADADFAQMWSGHAVIGKHRRTKRLLHPSVGEMTLEYHDFTMPDTGDLHLLVCDAEPGSRTEESLRLLGTGHDGEGWRGRRYVPPAAAE